MNNIDIHNLIERAKTNVKELRKLSAVNPSAAAEGDEIDTLIHRAESLLEEEELVETLDKRAAATRANALVIAKLLAAADVFSEVSR